MMPSTLQTFARRMPAPATAVTAGGGRDKNLPHAGVMTAHLQKAQLRLIQTISVGRAWKLTLYRRASSMPRRTASC